MGKLIRFPRRRRHARASFSLKPNTAGSASLPLPAKASRTIRKFSCGIRSRARQLLTADGPTPASEAAAAVPPSASITSSTELSMPCDTSQDVKMSSLHGLAVESDSAVMSDEPMADSLKVLSRRLKTTREALGLSAAELCRRIDVKENRWSQYESGERQITLPVAIAMCDEFGLSLDWIYRNDPSRIPHELRVKMRQAA